MLLFRWVFRTYFMDGPEQYLCRWIDDASQSNYFANKKWFGLATNYKRKWVIKPILANLGTRIFKNFSPVQTVVVPPGETNISKLHNALFIHLQICSHLLKKSLMKNFIFCSVTFIKSHLFKSWFGGSILSRWKTKCRRWLWTNFNLHMALAKLNLVSKLRTI